MERVLFSYGKTRSIVNLDVKDFSPAMVKDAIVVGNIDSGDTLHPLSNYGETVDLFAPGVSIVGPSAKGNRTYQYLTGTSQAAPHVSGVVAQILERHPSATPHEIERVLINLSAKNKIKNSKVCVCIDLFN